MVKGFKFIFTVVLSVTLTTLLAQKPKPNVPATKPAGFQKFTPPKLFSTWGIRTNTDTVFVEEARQLITIPLKVTDAKKNHYTISSYRFMYNRRAVTEEDDLSGKTTPVMSPVSQLFESTPLPPLWKTILSEEMQPGEVLRYFDVIVKDDQGHIMFAPELKIVIK